MSSFEEDDQQRETIVFQTPTVIKKISSLKKRRLLGIEMKLSGVCGINSPRRVTIAIVSNAYPHSTHSF